MTQAIAGAGTRESDWQPWLRECSWPVLDLDSVAGRRVVVLAAHPDDEVLGVSGLILALVTRGHELVTIWATDGEASHPGSKVLTPHDLGERRQREAHRALQVLGVRPSAAHHLGLPDGGLCASADRLDLALSALVRTDDVVICPWELDGHPDHEAVGRSALRTGAAVVWQYPIWMWHWATPGDPVVPWSRMATWPVPDVSTKEAAVAQFVTQVRPLGPDPADAAILPGHVLARLVRSHEWIIR